MNTTPGAPADGAKTPYFGRGIRRQEDRRLLLGRGRYVADIKLPGQAEMAVVRSPFAHARIRAIRVRSARAHPGVYCVITGRDIAETLKPLPALDLQPSAKPAFSRVLAGDVVRYVGEAIAAVVAVDRYTAEDAAELVEVDYEPLPALLSLEAALAPGAIHLYPDFGTNVVQTFAQEAGDVDQALATADRVYREKFSIHRYTGIPMETRGVLADADPNTGTVTLWTSTQFPHRVRDCVTEVLGWPAGRLRVIAPDVGGGFGVKEAIYGEEVLAPLLATRLGRPVRWIEDRAEHFVASCHGREQDHEVVAAVRHDGVITALESVCATNIGAAFATFSNAPGYYVSAMIRGPYRIPHYRSKVLSVVTNKTPLNVYRGAGHPQAVFCMERLLDRIADDLGLDRAEIRLRNMLTPAELPADRAVTLGARPNSRVIYDSGDYPRCLRQAVALLDYPHFRREQLAARNAGRYLGIGLSFYVEATAFGPYEFSELWVDARGAITLFTGSSPHGQGTATTHAQLVADELGVKVDAITVVHGDTGVVKEGIGTWGSRSGAVGGTAARLAAVKLKEAARDLARRLLPARDEELEWTEGRIHLRSDSQRGYSLAELAAASAGGGRADAPSPGLLKAEVRFQVPGVAYAYAAHIAIVEVEIATGRVLVRRYGVAHDCGRVINPRIVGGQIVGGVAQGIGGTILEELRYDADGRMLTRGLMDYLMPSAADIPPIELVHLETPTPHNPYGIKGAGEGGMTGAPGALVGAIEDALKPFGVRINDDGPFTPSRVLALVGKAARPQRAPKASA
ncbi:MAG TPA: xanthine dehydrogenase family protein molybdopterin-binding subunit [Opitutaceae bacterium]|jgi:carbon-monoxide dehydrogenase large subunit|nr:xanthine dehydrogenase family protein molybdopterin-binding subunit [Opitutaceae bacterium]